MKNELQLFFEGHSASDIDATAADAADYNSR